jgi:hypothetical protein
MENVFARLEGPVSPVKPVDICRYIRALIIDDGKVNLSLRINHYGEKNGE